MKREITRKRDDRFCRVEIEIENGRLSVCGSEGRIVRRARAKREALEYWRGYFEDNPGAIQEMNQRCGTRYTSPTGAARYVLSVDGEMHGLDVMADDGREVLIVEGCGQITDEIREWFPEVIPLLSWHLNDMKAGSPAQEQALASMAPAVYPETHYDKACNFLAEIGLNPDPLYLHDGKPYRYGSAWLKTDLPAEIVKLAETVAA